MSRKAKVIRVAEEAEDIVPIEYEEPDMIEADLADLPTEGTGVYFYRMYERGRPRFLQRMETGEFDIEAFKALYGGGRYRYVVKRQHEKLKEGQFEIDGEPRANEPREIPRDEANRYSTDPALSLLAEIKQSLESKKDQWQEKLLLSLLAERGQKEQFNEDKFLERMAIYKNLFSSQSDAGIGKALLDTVKDLVPVLNGGEVSPWFLIIDKLSPLLEKVAGAVTQGQPVQPQSQTAQVKVEKANTRLTSQPELGITEIIKPYLSLFITAASKDSDPEPYSAMVLDQCPATAVPQLLEFLATPDWLQTLSKCDNRILLQAAWWTELAEAIREETKPASQEQTESAVG